MGGLPLISARDRLHLSGGNPKDPDAKSMAIFIKAAHLRTWQSLFHMLEQRQVQLFRYYIIGTILNAQNSVSLLIVVYSHPSESDGTWYAFIIYFMVPRCCSG